MIIDYSPPNYKNKVCLIGKKFGIFVIVIKVITKLTFNNPIKKINYDKRGNF